MMRVVVVVFLGASSCGGSTFSSDDPRDARAPDDASTASHEAEPVDSTPADHEVDRGAMLDDAPVDGPADATYRGAVLADGPVAYWRMGIASGSIVPDESGHHNDLALQGTGHTLGVTGAIGKDTDRAIGFDGVNSHAVAVRPRDLDFPASAAFTIECWARRDRVADGGSGEYFQQIVSAAAGGPPNRNGYLLYVLPSDANPSLLRTTFEYDAPDKGQVGLDGPLAPLAAYTYYVATFDGAKVSFYIDGTLASSRPVDGSIATRMTEFVIGRESSTGRYHFAGAIDEVAVYDKALSTAQVIAHRELALRR
jgi:hypothetical protein